MKYRIYLISEEVLKGVFRPITTPWRTSITKVEPNRFITRGYQQEDLIGNISFSEMIYFLINIVLPTKKPGKDAANCVSVFLDHGVTPPRTQSARLMASARSH